MSVPDLDTLKHAVETVERLYRWEACLAHENRHLADDLRIRAQRPEAVNIVGYEAPRAMDNRDQHVLLHDALTGKLSFPEISDETVKEISAACQENGLDAVGPFSSSFPFFMRIERAKHERRFDGYLNEVGYVWLWADGSFRAGCVLGVHDTTDTMMSPIVPRTFIRAETRAMADTRLSQFTVAITAYRAAVDYHALRLADRWKVER